MLSLPRRSLALSLLRAATPVVSTVVPTFSKEVSVNFYHHLSLQKLSPVLETKLFTLTLFQIGDYITKINTNLLANNLPTSDLYVKQSLWACIEHGDIKLLEFCAAGCVGGDKNDDYCTGTGVPASKRDDIEEDLTEEDLAEENLIEEDLTREDLTGEDLTEEELVERAVAIEWKA